ncbi:MAG: DUF2309 family protein, partial [Planctomycetes bacterium]|nr:DUF2309 family protein [Planctomycetota bacterium]
MMIAMTLENTLHTPSNSIYSAKTLRSVDEQALQGALKDLHTIVPPLWPLADYVAVNPCLGVADQPFLAARQMLRHVRDCDLLMDGE